MVPFDETEVAWRVTGLSRAGAPVTVTRPPTFTVSRFQPEAVSTVGESREIRYGRDEALGEAVSTVSQAYGLSHWTCRTVPVKVRGLLKSNAASWFGSWSTYAFPPLTIYPFPVASFGSRLADHSTAPLA